ncbi:MAG: hypothetical protein KBF73_10980 [Flavobacteriales bacterium]|nr:hypothetical protein [Flavobacteriales bacterium]
MYYRFQIFFSWLKQHQEGVGLSLFGIICCSIPLIAFKINDIPLDAGWGWFVIGGLLLLRNPIRAFSHRTNWKVWNILSDLNEWLIAVSGVILAFAVVNYGFIVLILLIIWLLPVIYSEHAPSLATAIYVSLSLGFLMNVYLHQRTVSAMKRVVGRKSEKAIAFITRYYDRTLVLIYIYASYLVMIVIGNIMEFEGLYPIDWSPRANKAVLQSFVTFIAAERLVKYYLENIKKDR